MVYAIIIGTKADGSKKAVSDVLPLSKKLKETFRSIDDKSLTTVELFELV